MLPVKPQPYKYSMPQIERSTTSHQFTDTIVKLRRIWKLIGRPWY